MDKLDVGDDREKLKLVKLQGTLWKVGCPEYIVFLVTHSSRPIPPCRALFDPGETDDFDLLCAKTARSASVENLPRAIVRDSARLRHLHFRFSAVVALHPMKLLLPR